MYEEIKLIYPEKDIGFSEDLTGLTFGKWKVLYRTENDNTNKETQQPEKGNNRLGLIKTELLEETAT